MDLHIKNYNEKSFVVLGNDTRQVKEDLKNMGGKWNANLSTGAGWIFSSKQKETVEKWLINLNFDNAPSTPLLKKPKTTIQNPSPVLSPSTSFLDDFIKEYLTFIEDTPELDITFLETKESFVHFYQLCEEPQIELAKMFFDFLSLREGNYTFFEYKTIFDNYEIITKIILINLTKK